MQNRSIRYSAFLLAVLIAFSICAIEGDAQSRRRRRARRVTRPAVVRPVVTNPDIAAPGSEQASGPDGERIISTAEDTPADTELTGETATPKKGKARTSSDQNMQRTINNLSNQVHRLNEKLTQMQENDRSLIDMERLTRAEQRAENLRAQQVDVESKLADLQSRLEQAEYSLKPENIERSAAGYGSTRPEEAREARRRALESERARLQSQIRILETSRARLEQSVATADAEVDLLRRRLEQGRQNENAGSAPAEGTNSRTRPE
jgi:DNA repair exonuclease SbcCD ATPase subunit